MRTSSRHETRSLFTVFQLESLLILFRGVYLVCMHTMFTLPHRLLSDNVSILRRLLMLISEAWISLFYLDGF